MDMSGKTMARDFGYSINPLELKIEISRACNLSCSFCYPGDPDLWREDRHMPEDDVLGWIDWGVDNDIPTVRFTGGEPIMHPKIEMFCNYAHLRKRWIILNTNAMADDDLYGRLIYQDLRIGVPSLYPARVDEMTGCSRVLEKKLNLIDRALATGKSYGSMITALTP